MMMKKKKKKKMMMMMMMMMMMITGKKDVLPLPVTYELAPGRYQRLFTV